MKSSFRQKGKHLARAGSSRNIKKAGKRYTENISLADRVTKSICQWISLSSKKLVTTAGKALCTSATQMHRFAIYPLSQKGQRSSFSPVSKLSLSLPFWLRPSKSAHSFRKGFWHHVKCAVTLRLKRPKIIRCCTEDSSNEKELCIVPA